MNEKTSIILEIRAGVGGGEAALFAQNLLRMYTRYAEKRGWKLSQIDVSYTDLGGIRDVVVEVVGVGVDDLKYESGVHRIQRIPETEKSGRIHTSTASVVALPIVKQVDIQIRPEDLRIDTYRASGPGGQAVNKISSAVRITHLPTNTVVASQNGRSQHDNKDIAMDILRSRLYDKKMREEAHARGEMRRSSIGTGDRSEKIRTYNIPQDRLTDHRIKKKWHNVTRILDGDLGPILDAMKKAAHNE